MVDYLHKFFRNSVYSKSLVYIPHSEKETSTFYSIYGLFATTVLACASFSVQTNQHVPMDKVAASFVAANRTIQIGSRKLPSLSLCKWKEILKISPPKLVLGKISMKSSVWTN